MKQIKYLSFIPFLALLCLMTGCENDKDVYYPYYVNVPLAYRYWFGRCELSCRE